MPHYIDGFTLPIPTRHLDTYKRVSAQVADIWKEYGALEYIESAGDDMTLSGTRTFTEAVKAREDETVIFGWVVFPSKQVRDKANKEVAADPRMEKLIAPLIDPSDPIFDANKMVFGGFREFDA